MLTGGGGGGGGHAGPNGLHMDTNISIIIYNTPAMQLMYIKACSHCTKNRTAFELV